MESVIAGRSPVRRGLCLASLALGFVAGLISPAAAADQPVDVELVLAVDVSWSMDHEEQLIQRDGYAAAFRSKDVIDAILSGGYSRVAVTYIEWAGETTQITVVPWTLIDSSSAAKRFADALTLQEPVQLRRTSISGALDFARGRFATSGFRGQRRIIDVSGDGPNNEGRMVTSARDETVAAGITINGLPLMTNTSTSSGGFSVEKLDTYYSDCVIGGGQAFMIPVTSWEEFPGAVRRKLVLELAGRGPGEWPVFRDQAGMQPPVVKAEATNPAAGMDCEIGEKLWDQRRMMWTDP
jgi:hypothetical protein